MMRYRMKKWDWTRRKRLIPHQGPAAVINPVAGRGGAGHGASNPQPRRCGGWIRVRASRVPE